jgi:hypothetical protein
MLFKNRKCSGLKQVGGQFACKTERAWPAFFTASSEVAAVVAKQQYPRKRLLKSYRAVEIKSPPIQAAKNAFGLIKVY